jgi:hypothetical protein
MDLSFHVRLEVLNKADEQFLRGFAWDRHWSIARLLGSKSNEIRRKEVVYRSTVLCRSICQFGSLVHR